MQRSSKLVQEERDTDGLHCVPYTPQHNGKVNRLNRSLTEKAGSLIFDSKMEKSMWGEAAFAQ